jgi:hypothetical protein
MDVCTGLPPKLVFSLPFGAIVMFEVDVRRLFCASDDWLALIM